MPEPKETEEDEPVEPVITVPDDGEPVWGDKGWPVSPEEVETNYSGEVFSRD